MLRPTAPQSAPTPMPGPRAAPECEALLFPPLARPTRGPQGHLGAQRVLPLSVWRLATGLPGQGVPLPHDAHGPLAIPDTPLDTVLATGAEAGARWQALGGQGAQRAAAKPRALRMRPGAGTHTVAPKGARAWAPRAPSRTKERTAAPCPPTMAPGELPCPWPPARRRPWSGGPRGGPRASRAPQRAVGPAEALRASVLVAVTPERSARACARRA